MKLHYVFLAVVFMAFLYTGSASNSVKANREQIYELDIVKPIKLINSKVLKFLGSFQLLNLLQFILDLWNDCLKNILNPPAKALGINFDNTLPNLNMSDPRVFRTFAKLQKVNLDPVLDLFAVQIGPNADEKFCNTDGFRIIHNFLWVDDHQVEDYMKFLYKAKYPQIYDKVHALYKIFDSLGCYGLIKDLPKVPSGRSKRSTNPFFEGTLPNVRQQYLDSVHKIRADDDEPEGCTLNNIMKILGLAQNSGLLELLDLIDTFIHELNTDATLHFAVGKVAEPIKGKSFRKFRLLQPVRDFMKQIHQALINDDIISGLFDTVKQLLQLDFYLINPVDLIISIVEFLIWGTPFLPPEL